MVIKCDCTSNSKGAKNGARFQNAILGTGRRFANPLPQKDVRRARCTVCGTVRDY